MAQVGWLVFRDKVSLVIFGCPGTHSVDQAGLELTEIHLRLPLGAGIKGMCNHTQFMAQVYNPSAGEKEKADPWSF